MATSPTERPGVLDADGRTIRLDEPAGRVQVVVRREASADKPARPLPPSLAGPDGRPNARYRDYLKYQQAHAAAQQAYRAAHKVAFDDPHSAARWPIDGVALQAAVDRALTDWYALGHKAEVEALLPPPD